MGYVSREEFGKDHGVLHEAVVTGRKAEWAGSEWSYLAKRPEFMRMVKAVMRGEAKIVTTRFVSKTSGKNGVVVADDTDLAEFYRHFEDHWDKPDHPLNCSFNQKLLDYTERYTLESVAGGELAIQPIRVIHPSSDSQIISDLDCLKDESGCFQLSTLLRYVPAMIRATEVVDSKRDCGLNANFYVIVNKRVLVLKIRAPGGLRSITGGGWLPAHTISLEELGTTVTERGVRVFIA